MGISIVVYAILAPGLSYADTSVSTAQILPPGGSNCAALQVISTQTYMDGAELQSFDVTIADSSYVSVVASVGDTSIPLRYMTRWAAANGALKIHVDVPPTRIFGSVPVTMTLLSSPAGQPTCVSVISFSVRGGAKAASGGNSSRAAATHAKPPVTVPQQGTSSASSSVSGTTSSSTATSVISPIFAAAFTDRFANMCTATNSFRLWFLLLALYAVVLAVVALALPSLATRSAYLPIALSLIPLILLVGFWYFAPACRAANWIPLALVAAAVAGLLVTYREQGAPTGNMPDVIQLPAAKKKTSKA